jgi:hypothetical protein
MLKEGDGGREQESEVKCLLESPAFQMPFSAAA